MIDVHVLAINRPQQIAVREDDVLGDFCTFFDEEGDEVESEKEAVSAVIEWRDGSGFTPLRFEDFKSRKVH